MAEAVPDQVFLGWDKTLLEAVKDWLMMDASALAETLIVVPTANSGRRLRLALSEEGGGLLAPHVMPPSKLFGVEGAASRSQLLWAWARAIQSIKVSDFPHLFPNHPEGALNSFHSAMALARQMLSLRDSLADVDKGFREVLEVSPEKDRWRELGQLEAYMLQVLKDWKLRDAIWAQRERAGAPVLPVGVSRIVVAGVPDPALLALKALQTHCASGIPVTVLMHAPEEERDTFSPWGVPLAKDWNTKMIPFPNWEECLHVVDSASDAANHVVKLFAENETSSSDAALALCDVSFGPALQRSMEAAGWPLYDPDGKSVLDSGVIRLLGCCGELLRHPKPFDAVRELVRLPGAEMFLPNHMGCKRAAQLMDELHHRHLPETLEDAQALASGKARSVLDAVVQKLREIKLGQTASGLSKWLAVWLQKADRNFARQVEPTLAEVIDAIEYLEAQGQEIEPQEAMEMLIVSLGGVRLSLEKGDEVLDLQGWLEVSYDPAQHLVLAGMHEGCVPDSAMEDVFIPDSLKKELGMRNASGRCARDAFLLYTALKSREQRGKVDAIVARFNDVGEARKPSRLLMRYEGKELSRIVTHLFAEAKSEPSVAGAWTRDWTLNLPDVENGYLLDSPRSLSPSAIKDYMSCPLRFFLKRVVKMEVFEAEKREMDALDFGNLCHKVLEIFGNDTSIRDSVDEEEIADYLSATLDQCVENDYGKSIHLPLMVQVESARERLRAFASQQVMERVAGWRIVETEFKVGHDEVPWYFAGHPIRMTVDRIDYNEVDKRWRVWDYKTTGKAKSPEEQHLKSWREEENRLLLGELYPKKGRQSKYGRRWADVQLPLYAAFVRDHFQADDLPGVGYINLPRAVNDVKFLSWYDFDENMLEHALVWAKGAVEGITAGNYQQAAVYPASERGWDDFEELAPDGLAAAFGLEQG